MPRAVADIVDRTLAGKSAENPVPNNYGATVISIALIVVQGVMQLMPLGRVKKPAEQAGFERHISVADIAR